MSSLRPVKGEPDEIVGSLADWLAADVGPEPLLIETSGSTGQPKRVLLSRAAVVASAEATHQRLGGPKRWTLVLPPAYVAGVQVIVRSLLAGHRPALQLDREGGYLSLVPTQLHRLLETDADTLASYHAVLLGGGPIDPVLRERAEALGIRVIATYGMSETAGGCVYDGVPLDGVGCRIADDGRVELSGPMLFDGYAGDPAATAAVLRDGWFRTDDLGDYSNGRLRVLGRADDVINSGGVKVPAGAVARRLREHPDVEAAEVIGIPDDEWGESVVAWVVGSAGLDELRDWVGERHPRSWAPRRVIGVEAIPLLSNGKPDRVRLRAEAAAR